MLINKKNSKVCCKLQLNMLPQEVRWPLLQKAMALSERTRQDNTGQWFSSVCTQWKNEIKNNSCFRQMYSRFLKC